MSLLRKSLMLLEIETKDFPRARCSDLRRVAPPEAKDYRGRAVFFLEESQWHILVRAPGRLFEGPCVVAIAEPR